ncbi:unnamed protein product [Linum trigynum]|uniref:Uncharacterized protein n=1 Tax=Linum trigynum TaxID=586398 RepID=A0AAV2GBK7_9ROSI
MRLLFDHYKHRLGLPGSSPIVIQEDVQEPSGSRDGKKKGKIWGDFRKMKRDAIPKGTRKSSKSEFDRYLEEEEDDEVVTRALVGSEEDEYKIDILGWWSRNWIRSSDSELVADGEDEGDEVVFQNVYVAFQARSASAPAGPSGSSRAGPSGSSPATHVLVSSPTMSQVEEDYVDNNSDENDETYVDVEPDEE